MPCPSVQRSVSRGFLPLCVTIALAGVGTVQVGAANTCPDFADYQFTYPVGAAPRSAAVADFDHDGHTDLVVVNSGASSNSVSILLGNHDLSIGFEASVEYAVGSKPVAVAVGDFDRDGDVDVAVVNRDSNNVSILIGNGSGAFSAAVNYTVGVHPTSIAAADFNRDGKLDLAVTNENVGTPDGGTASILLGSGSGTFSASATYNVSGAPPIAITVGDFNGDGHVDLAIANGQSEAAPDGTGLSVLLGQADGAFATAVHYGAGVNPTAIAAADFDRNGTADLAISDQQDAVWILAGNGDGTFSTAVSHPAHQGPVSVAAADLTQDGFPDLAVVNLTSNDLSILVGKGDRTFAAPMNYATPNAVAVVALDIKGLQAKPDDLAVVKADSGSITVLMNAGACTYLCGTFVAGPQPAVTVGSSPSSVAAADFDRDGNPDLAVTNATSGTVSILFSNGNGTFRSGGTYTVGTFPVSVVAGDLDRDGKIDLVVANSGSNDVSILIGEAAGEFRSAASPMNVGSNPSFLALGDFDRDGILDVAVPNSGSNSITILRGAGDGSFSAVTGCCDAGASPWSIAADDFNHDAILDLAVVNNGDSNVWILNGDGTGSLTHTGTYSTGAAPSADHPRFVATGDFNRDGKPDLVITNFGEPGVTVGTTFSYLAASSAGDGTFVAAVQFPAHDRPASLLVLDFTLDNALDLAVANHDSNDVSIIPGGGDGTFGPFTPGGPPPPPSLRRETRFIPSTNIFQSFNVSAGSGPYSVATADFDRDGKPDLVVADFDSNVVSILVTQSCGIPQIHATMTHDGDFVQNDVGRTYTIVVSNTGAVRHGTTTVSVNPPPGLTVTSMAGQGWTCATWCERNDDLTPVTPFPPVIVFVNVLGGAPSTVTMRASINASIEVLDPTTITPAFSLPSTNLSAFPIYAPGYVGDTRPKIAVAWQSVPGAAGYWLYRRAANEQFVQIETCGPVNSPSYRCGTNYLDNSPTVNTCYFYQVRAFDSSGTPGVWSDIDMATAILLTDDPIEPGKTSIKARHTLELRDAVNALLAAAGMPAAAFTDAIAPGMPVRPVHINELMSSVNAARGALGLPTIAFTDVTTNDLVRAVDINRIRAGIQ